MAAMYRASADDRGTVQALSKELDEAQEDGKYFLFILFSLVTDNEIQKEYLSSSVNRASLL